MRTHTEKRHPDFLIVGAGIAGTALAVGLKKKGFQVLLIERDSAPRDRFKGEFLQPFTVKQLTALGFGDLLCGENSQKIHELKFRDLDKDNNVISEVLIPYLEQDFAAVVPHKELICGLQKRAAEILGDSFMLGTTALPLNLNAQDFSEQPLFLLTSESGASLEVAPRFVIGCDGRQSVVRSWMGGPKAPAMGSPTLGTQPEFIVGAEIHGKRAKPERYEVIRTASKGTIALFQTSAQTQRLYWNVAATPGSNKKSWEASIGNILPGLKNLAELESDKFENVAGCPADQIWFGPAAKESFFLVGDALAVTSPLGGQGMTIAMREVAILLEYFQEYVDGTSDIESLRDRYESIARSSYLHICLLNFGLYYLFFASGRLFKLVSRFILGEWNKKPEICARVGELFSGMSWNTPSLNELLELWGILPVAKRKAGEPIRRRSSFALPLHRIRYPRQNTGYRSDRQSKTS